MLPGHGELPGSRPFRFRTGMLLGQYTHAPPDIFFSPDITAAFAADEGEY